MSKKKILIRISKFIGNNHNKDQFNFAIQLNERDQEFEQLKQQLIDLSNLLFPNQSYNFTLFKEEVSRLKRQDLTLQVKEQKEQLEQLITNTKTQADNLEYVVDLLLKIQKQISKIKSESNDYYHLQGQLTAF
ncbi:7025_t:CDS:2 [Racocetra fulgida]|uniref:7025_t:CDS:1 n=1 Tax=Racocetra fulgida TaxID=60492 RepID=A0A9N8VYE2_9GLOM|nr:7025_t:CDS:2 [Racocetra fulgida]